MSVDISSILYSFDDMLYANDSPDSSAHSELLCTFFESNDCAENDSAWSGNVDKNIFDIDECDNVYNAFDNVYTNVDSDDIVESSVIQLHV